MIYLELFLTFFLIGMFTIGGGYAMLSLIQNQVVTIHGWIDDTTFTDIVAISQMTPGPIGINSATYIGYEVLAQSGASELMSILGSFTATFAVVLPSFIIVLLLAKVYSRRLAPRCVGTHRYGCPGSCYCRELHRLEELCHLSRRLRCPIPQEARSLLRTWHRSVGRIGALLDLHTLYYLPPKRETHGNPGQKFRSILIGKPCGLLTRC